MNKEFILCNKITIKYLIKLIFKNNNKRKITKNKI